MSKTHRTVVYAVGLLAFFLPFCTSAGAQDASSGYSRTATFMSELRGLLSSPGLRDFVQNKVAPNYRPNQFPAYRQQQWTPAEAFPPNGWQQESSRAGAYQRDFHRTDQSAGSPTSFRTLLPAEARALGRYDISVLIDQSASMSERDCPSPFNQMMRISRWDWCRQQTAFLANQTVGTSSRLTIVPFSSKAQRFPGASAADIHRIFASTTPSGSTNLAAALRSELDVYIQAKQAGFRNRPLMIAVISDGVPNSRGAVKKIITEATRTMSTPDEIKITFLQVGTDSGGSRFLEELDSDLVNQGAAADVVSTRDFHELQYTGLPSALASSISNRRF